MTGYAAVFYRAGEPGTEYELWPGFIERVMPGCFDRALSERQDVRGLVNHDSNQVIGRFLSGTMRLSVDQIGLRYEIDLPDTTAGRDIAISVDRGDISGSSFAFLDVETTYVRGENGAPDYRELRDVNVFDVGPVTYPAYEATTTGIRSADAETLKREFDAWAAQQRGSCNEGDEIAVRLSLLKLDSR